MTVGLMTGTALDGSAHFFARVADLRETGSTNRIILDAVDESSPGLREGPLSLDRATDSAGNYWRSLFDGAGPDRNEPDPFASMRIRSIELNISDRSDLQAIRGGATDWVRLTTTQRSESGGLVARVDDPSAKEGAESLEVGVRSIQPVEDADALNAAFSMSTWPTAQESAVGRALGAMGAFAQVVALDVGQGMSHALVDRSGTPLLYVDLGAGFGANANSRPVDLEFCSCARPAVILSHWDTDHWFGARCDPSMLAMHWIAPRQAIGPTHSQFANDVLRSGGSLSIVDAGFSTRVELRWSGPYWRNGLAPIQQELHVATSNGRSRNDSGLAVQVVDLHRDCTWLFPGDAAYRYLPFLGSPVAPVTVVAVSHHGAKQPTRSTPPTKSVLRRYGRLLYSYGPGNTFKHPRAEARAQLAAGGWGYSDPQWAGVPRIGADVLATAEPTAGTQHRSAVGAGWLVRPRVASHLTMVHQMTIER